MPVRRLQSVLNATVRLTYHLRRSDHITDALVCMPPLAARAGASPVQNRRFGLQKSCTDSCRNISVQSTTSTTSLASDLSVLRHAISPFRLMLLFFLSISLDVLMLFM